jgi:hypothetical protein
MNTNSDIDSRIIYEEVTTICPRKDCHHSCADLDDSHLTGWSMIGFSNLHGDDLTLKTTGDILQISMTVKRNPFGLVMILIVPLIICIILSLTSFVLDPEALSERLQITVTMLLAAAAFHQQARGHIPPNLPYTTVLDKYMLGTLFMLLLQAFIHVLIASVKESETESDAASLLTTEDGGISDLTYGQPAKLSPLETLFSCECAQGRRPELLSSVAASTGAVICHISHSSHLGDRGPLSARAHRLSFFAAVFFILCLYHIHTKTGTWKRTWNSIVSTVLTSARAAATFVSWFAGGMLIFLTMSLGCHTITFHDIQAFASHFVPTFNASTWAMIACLQGNCKGPTNDYICKKEVLTLLEWVLHDENLLEFMIFAIIFVHLVLWVEFIN